MSECRDESAASPPHPRRFGVLRSWKTAPYLIGSGTAMMGDNIEHVITYWVLWQEFESPALVGFQLISHWLPFLLLSVYAGSLAERFDCRRLIQIGQFMFMFVSLCWGILFLTDSLQLWQACVLLVIHGLAGCLWGPAEQMMLHDFVEREELPSAVRMNATFRSLGILFGPVVGSALLLAFGPTWGIFINIVFYLPLTIFLMLTPFTGHTRSGGVRTARTTLVQSLKVLAEVRHNKSIIGMLLLAALASMTIGAVLQTAMPVFGDILTGPGGDSDFTYGLLLFALGAGGVLGGFFLEATGWVRPTPAAAAVAAAGLGASSVVFAFTSHLWLALSVLVLAGVCKITAESTEMAIIQLEAPTEIRGRVIGSYATFGPGMQTFSGVTVGVLGTIATIPQAVTIGGTVLAIGAIGIGAYVVTGRRSTHLR
ncbi:Transmembrane secretion effector [Brevibacterium sandarakinum]|uniref:Transmembrane secretion effector n=1 Tax=Brevibacterium sandarakinum TaxID=629680 RepID=A0A1H1SRX7_BRESA|nr:MFS transporter [Brevibacterium sandarakinum]SDS50603.1 Transmembrane secretion effector [Brevibacterium sandarakinum]